MSKSKLTTLIICFFGLFFASSAQATEMDSLHSGACKSDMERFCKGVSPGQGRLMACLKSHDNQLTPECTQAWQSAKTRMHSKMQQAMNSAHEACGSDMQKFCGNVSGHGEISECLKSHSTELSPSCKTFQTTMRERTSHVRNHG